MGMFLDDTAMLVIVAPLYVPLVKTLDLGIDGQMIWFGILYTMTCQIAYITPPFGYNLFLMRGLAPKEIMLADIYRSIWPFVIMMMITIALVMLFPQIAMWLPQWVRS
jgi:TRAP-type mannitol/chloroaromatic compound transport system permease large subunit